MASSNVCWGVDIGAGAVKAIKLERDGDDVRVDDFVVVPHKKVLSTPDLDEADALRVALGALMAEYGESMRGEHVAVSIPGHSSFARFAKLPPVEPKGVHNLVRFEAVQQIPFPIEEVEWDYQVFASEDTPDVEVGIFAVTREKVNEWLHLWGEVGLRPDQVTLSPVAVYNAVAYDLQFTEETPGTIILDIGTQASDLIIAEGGKVWIRTFPLGGHHFTEALAETFKLTYSKAEKLKREAETSKYKRHIFQALKPILSDLVQDVQRSIGYYQDTHPDAKLERLVGIGSTFKLLGLRKLLSQQLKIDVYRLESFKRISVDGAGAVDFEAASLNMATAYGLALQGLGLTPIDANLMPASVIRESVWKRKTPWFVAAAAIGILGAGTSFLRPFLDQQTVEPIGQDPQIRTAINRGQQLKSEWQRISEENQPKFRADNIRRLFERRDLYFMILEDVSRMLADANAHPDAPETSRAFELYALETAYVPPGGTVPTFATKQADAGDGTDGGAFASRRGGRGGGFEDEGGDAGGPGTAGEHGAMIITAQLDSASSGGKVFFNDTILEWLREGIDPTARPYEITAVPVVDQVRQTEVTGAIFEGGAEAGAAFPGAQRGAAPGVPGGMQRPERGAPRGMQTETRPPRDAGRPARGSGSDRDTPNSLAELAPLEEPEPRYGEDATVYRYTVRWVIQLKERPAEPAEGQEDDAARAGGPESDEVTP